VSIEQAKEKLGLGMAKAIKEIGVNAEMLAGLLKKLYKEKKKLTSY